MTPDLSYYWKGGREKCEDIINNKWDKQTNKQEDKKKSVSGVSFLSSEGTLSKNMKTRPRSAFSDSY